MEKGTKRAVNFWTKFRVLGQCALLKLRENHVTAMQWCPPSVHSVNTVCPCSNKDTRSTGGYISNTKTSENNKKFHLFFCLFFLKGKPFLFSSFYNLTRTCKTHGSHRSVCHYFIQVLEKQFRYEISAQLKACRLPDFDTSQWYEILF